MIGRLAIACAMLGVIPLLLWDALPGFFPWRAHERLAALPLALAAMACLVHAIARRGPWKDLAKAGILAAAFLFWAANQFWPDHPKAILFNDVAIVLFLVDVSYAILDSKAAA